MEPSTIERTSYEPPPWPEDEAGAARGVGLELEIGALSLEETLRLVRDALGGLIVQDSPAEGRVEGTAFGKFKVEIDSLAIKDRSYLRKLDWLGVDGDSAVAQKVEQSVIDVARELVPLEVVTPPIPWNRMHELDVLWAALRQAGAADTKSSVLYAFGLHLNPVIPRRDTRTLLAVTRAFLLLEDWIVADEDVDLTRWITPFIRQFPEPYRRKVLDPDYAPDFKDFVDDYVEHNPTRNRSLDLLPLLAHLGASGLEQRVTDWQLVNARPTFHYRLPNCELAQAGWTPAADWNRWVMVERLAHDAALLRELSEAYLRTLALPLRLQRSGWTDQVREWLSRLGAGARVMAV
jgi:hypothetical protein